jgi:hypothetical protein
MTPSDKFHNFCEELLKAQIATGNTLDEKEIIFSQCLYKIAQIECYDTTTKDHSYTKRLYEALKNAFPDFFIKKEIII